METALLSYFVLNNDLRSTCDFNPYVLEKGVSIYEVLRVEQKIPVFLQEHITRFFSSANLENIPVDFSVKFVQNAVKLLIEQNKMHQGNIKFLYHWGGEDDDRFMAWVMPFFYPSAKHYAEGVVVGSMQAERENPNAKKHIFSLREQADALIKEKNLWEVVYVNNRGYLTEGSRSNVFFVRGNRLFTPELSLVLPGITRAKVLQLAATEKISVEETRIKITEIKKFDACFFTGTSPKILPVSEMNGISFDVQNRLMTRLMLGYDDLMERDIRRFSW